LKYEYVMYSRSGPIDDWSQPGLPAAIGVRLTGLKQVAATPLGRGPAAMYSLSLNGTLLFASVSLSGV
jgi:hypothetical protein